MTQEQLNLIAKILQNGAPALANELINSIVTLFNTCAELQNKLEQLENKEGDD